MKRRLTHTKIILALAVALLPTYSDGKLSYTSEAGETFEYRANSRELPKINGQPVNLNPAKTFDSPFLSMVHGWNKAVIHCAGYEDVVLDFGN